MHTLSQGLFSVLRQSAIQEAGGEHGQGSWPKSARGIFCNTECPAQSISQGSWPGGANRCWRRGWAWVSGCWAILLSITWHSGFMPLSLFFLLLSYLSLLQFLNCSYLSPWILALYDPPPHPTRKVSEQIHRMITDFKCSRAYKCLFSSTGQHHRNKDFQRKMLEQNNW